MKYRKTYIRSIDAVFGKDDAYSEVPDLIESGCIERRDGRLAFGVAYGDVLGLSIERESISWALLGPRGPISSRSVDAPVAPIGGERVMPDELEEIVAGVLDEVAPHLAGRPLAGVGVAWPAPVALDGVPYDEAFGGALMEDEKDPRRLVRSALVSAGIATLPGEDGEAVVEMINDADADLLYDARLGVGRGVRELMGLKICGGIGLSLVHHGRLVRGHAGRAGEIEHIKVRFEDFTLPDEWGTVTDLEDLDPCPCNGTKCIARFATGKTIIDQLADYADRKATYNERGRRIENDQRRDVVTAVFTRAGMLLGQALLGPVLAFDPERIIVSAFPKHANLLQGLRTALTDGTRVHLEPDDIVFASAKPERTAAGAGWLVVEQEVIPRIEEALGTGDQLLRYHLPYWLRTQVAEEEQAVSPFGPRYAPEKAPDLISD